MKLQLEQVTKTVGAETHIHPINLTLQESGLTVLLGATLAGKTTLMRLMAGLDQPSSGRVRVDGADVTGLPVRKRNVAMVYQQFINYPSMTVFNNIASPLRLKGGLNAQALQQRVQALAERLHIAPFLQRLPAELSGGQQQRVALARALAKNAPLTLLDEPLVNLDYKLREDLRVELGALFGERGGSIVYATTEPTEALLLGGWTAVLDAGELLQYGPTPEVFHRPASLRVARAFSDPPMNLMPGGAARLGAALVARAPQATPDTTVGLRASALRLEPRPGDEPLPGQVQLAEISGSDTFLHVKTPAGELVAQVGGVHVFELGAAVTLHYAPEQLYVFGADGLLRQAPRQER